jgi:hypothetical protein
MTRRLGYDHEGTKDTKGSRGIPPNPCLSFVSFVPFVVKNSDAPSPVLHPSPPSLNLHP